MKTIYFLLALILLSVTAKSQVLIDTNYSHIKRYMASKRGILGTDKAERSPTQPQLSHLLNYYFPESIAKREDIRSMSFFLNKQDQCYQYQIDYVSDKFLQKLTDSLNNIGLKLVKKRDSMTWTNPSKIYRVSILLYYNNVGERTNGFILEFSKKTDTLKTESL